MRARSVLAIVLTGCCPPSATTTATTTPTPPDTKGDIVQPTRVDDVRPAETKIDGGTLAIAINGAPAGTEGFEVRRVGTEFVVENHVDANLLGVAVRGRGELRYDTRGRTRSGTMVMSVDGVAIATAIAGGPDAMVVTVKAGDGAAQDKRATGPVDLYVDNNSFSHLAALCSVDGPQVTAFPQMVIKRGAAREANDARVVTFEAVGSGELEVYCDGVRFLGVDMPSSGLTVTRTGEEERVGALRTPRP